jgi:outer membrane protein assembly factor BamE
MNCPKTSHGTLRAAAATLVLLAGAMLGACVHRPYIQQGNFLETKDIDQVTTGMTRSQVRYLLGTPMISDPFTAQRWDYIYTLKRGRVRKIDRSHFAVYFEDDKVIRIDKLDAPEPKRARPDEGLPQLDGSDSDRGASPPDDDDKPQEPKPEAPQPTEG